MKILLASDHAGFALKKLVGTELEKKGYEIEDLGPSTLNEQDDYPELIRPVAERIAKDNALKGIVFGGSGQGEAIVANREKGVRAIVYNTDNIDIVAVGRQHNDANVLSIGARFVSDSAALAAVEKFLSEPFSEDERHVRRIKAIDNI